MSIDYAFEGGSLHYNSTLFDNGTGGTTEKNDSFLIPVGPDRKTITKYQKELSDQRRIAESPDGDGAIEYSILNADADKENGIDIYQMGIGGKFQHPVGEYELICMAAANLDRAILVINNPGSNKSSLLPKDVIQEMMRSGSFEAQGKWILSMLSEVFDRYENYLSLKGNSAGARATLGLAAAMLLMNADANKDKGKYNNIGDVRVIDPPGAQDKSTLGVVANFASQLPRSTDYANLSPYNPYKSHGEGKPPVIGKDVIGKDDAKKSNLFTAKDAALQNGLWFPKSMRKRKGLQDDLIKARELIVPDGDLTVIQPEFSEFARPEAMMQLLAEIAIKSLGDAALRHVLLENHSHAIMSAGAGPEPIVAAYLLAYALAA